MRVFLDVGAHVGETVPAVLDPRWGFDRIVCFEPVEACARAIERTTDPRVEVHQIGLWDRNEERPIFNAGDVGATIFEDKQWNHAPSGEAETIRLVRASDWFRDNLNPDDVVYAKINVEGCECDIIDDLIDAGLMGTIAALMVDFDVRKIPSQAAREAQVRARMDDLGIPYDTGGDPRVGHFTRVQIWLEAGGAAVEMTPAARARSTAIRVRNRTIPAVARKVPLGRLIRRVVPAKAYRRLLAALRIGGYGRRP